MREPRVVRLLGPERLEDTGCLQLIRVRLVRRRRGRGERDSVEDLGFRISLLKPNEPVHRALVREDARALILVLEVVVQLADGADVAALAVGDATGELHRGIGCLLALLQ